MALVKPKTVADTRPIAYDDEMAALIQRRRYQILLHSLIYYELDVSLVEDHQWSEWANELVKLQKENPDISSRVIFYEAFKDFDGSTGFNLPFRDEQICRAAFRLLQNKNTAEAQEALHKLKYQVAQTPAEYDRYKKKSHTKKEKPVVKKEVKPVEQKQRKGLFSVPRK